MEEREVILSVRGLYVRFGHGRNRFEAVKNASFDIYRGETFGIVGESGSGKTTIGRLRRIHPLPRGGNHRPPAPGQAQGAHHPDPDDLPGSHGQPERAGQD